MNCVCTEPKSKSIEAVVELLRLLGRPIAPLPESIVIRDAVLVLSAKKDAYYTVTSKACSCPAFAFHSRPCKHQRKYFKDSCARNEVPKTECASDSIKPVLIWPSGHSGF